VSEEIKEGISEDFYQKISEDYKRGDFEIY
jgi:hypothetical protein